MFIVGNSLELMENGEHMKKNILNVIVKECSFSRAKKKIINVEICYMYIVYECMSEKPFHLMKK